MAIGLLIFAACGDDDDDEDGVTPVDAEIGAKLHTTRQRAQAALRPKAKVRRLIEQRSNGACEQCGKPPRNPLHIHHVSAANAETFNHIENLRHLCQSCHQKEHQ